MNWLSKWRERLNATHELKAASRKTGSWLLFSSAVFAVPLIQWFLYAIKSDSQSHLVLIPFISAYLLWVAPKPIPLEPGGSRSKAIGYVVVGLILGLLYLSSTFAQWPLHRPDALSPAVAGFIFVSWAGLISNFGAATQAALRFPILFLFLATPLPEGVLTGLETLLQHASAEVSQRFFEISGIAHFREGLVFRLPGITIRVAQECSGVRSTIVLLITSLAAGHLFLRSTLNRTLLVAITFILGIFRNAFRIWVIAWLCVERGPHMINAWIHKQGGPVFFALSLLPLGCVLWLMIRIETRRREEKQAHAVASP